MSIYVYDEVIGRKHDVWQSEINVKLDKQSAKQLLKMFKNPKQKSKESKESKQNETILRSK